MLFFCVCFIFFFLLPWPRGYSFFLVWASFCFMEAFFTRLEHCFKCATPGNRARWQTGTVLESLLGCRELDSRASWIGNLLVRGNFLKSWWNWSSFPIFKAQPSGFEHIHTVVWLPPPLVLNSNSSQTRIWGQTRGLAFVRGALCPWAKSPSPNSSPNSIPQFYPSLPVSEWICW